MPRDINTRLENLRIRRKGVDAARSGRVTASVADEVLRKSVIQESWQRRATEQPYTRYALGAMQAVDPAYTQKSHDEADRVAKQLRSGLSIPIEMRLQGSVPLDVHIRGVSDVDLLVIRTDFLCYDTFGALATSGWYSPSSKTSLSVLRELRIECEELLKRRYWGADVDCDGGKCIALSGGSFERPVDVVPSHWHDTVDYQASRLEQERGVYILDKKIPDTFSNLPFKHIKRVHERDLSYFGGLKKAIRLVKNVKNDASDESTAALMYHADETSLKAGYVNELHILSEAQRFLDWCYRNKDDAGRLTTPDGLRRILDTEAKRSGLLAISSELDDLAQQVAREQGSLGPSPSWSNVYSTLGSARVPDAA